MSLNMTMLSYYKNIALQRNIFGSFVTLMTAA